MSEPSANGAVRVIIHGLVQGVGFRYFVLRAAQLLELQGWAQNMRDGTVEVHAEGPEVRLSQLLGLLAQGPRGSRVTHVETLWIAPKGEYADFSIC